MVSPMQVNYGVDEWVECCTRVKGSKPRAGICIAFHVKNNELYASIMLSKNFAKPDNLTGEEVCEPAKDWNIWIPF